MGFGFADIQLKLQKRTGGIDTAGCHNLHRMPGALGGLIAIVLVSFPL